VKGACWSTCLDDRSFKKGRRKKGEGIEKSEGQGWVFEGSDLYFRLEVREKRGERGSVRRGGKTLCW